MDYLDKKKSLTIKLSRKSSEIRFFSFKWLSRSFKVRTCLTRRLFLCFRILICDACFFSFLVAINKHLFALRGVETCGDAMSPTYLGCINLRLGVCCPSSRNTGSDVWTVLLVPSPGSGKRHFVANIVI